MTAPAVSTRLPLGGLLVLSGAIFASVTSEFLPTGLLPEMARDLGVSEARVGLLVTAFATTVILSTVPLTALTARVPRKVLMVTLLGVFALANLLAALAPSYEPLAAARVLGGMAHGLFWAVAGPYAARMVRPDQLARALSISNAGGSIAFILGVPVGTALGQFLGWRAAFAVMAGVVLVFLVLVVLVLPPVEHRVTLATGELSLPVRRDRTIPAIIIVASTVLLFATGHNALYTYIAPWGIQVAGLAEESMGGVLLAFGVAGALGLGVAGILGDRFPRAAMPALFALGAIAVALMPAAAAVDPGLAVLLLAVWSFAFGGTPALAHARMMTSASLRLRDLAAALMTIAFNGAIALGALIGALVVEGPGVELLPWLACGGFVIAALFALGTDRRRLASSGPAARHPHRGGH